MGDPTGANILGQSKPKSYGNVEVLHILQNSKDLSLAIIGSYPEDWLKVGLLHSAEVQP